VDVALNAALLSSAPAQEECMDLLEVHHLSVFRRPAGPRRYRLQCRIGAILHARGAFGCGKTTLLRLLGGFSEPDSGEVLFDGKSLQGVPPDIAPCTRFSSYALFPHMTVAANIAFPLRMQKLRRHDIDGRLGSLIETSVCKASNATTRTEFRRTASTWLSPEHWPRVPGCSLLDEPLSALDAALQTQMLHELIALQQQLGVAFIYVTHDQTHALALSQRIAVMHEGHIVQLDTPEAIYRAPATTFVAGFIGPQSAGCHRRGIECGAPACAHRRCGRCDMPAGASAGHRQPRHGRHPPEEIQLRPRGASPGGNASAPMSKAPSSTGCTRAMSRYTRSSLPADTGCKRWSPTRGR
jgi:spermidine/putrescine transport system ATP-binding protein